MSLKNRNDMPAMASYHAAVNGEATEKLIRYHEERAKGGVGMNIVEATYVARSGNSFDLGLGISDDFMIKGLSKLTDAVHRHDGKIAIQLQHGGRFGNPPTSGCPRLLVSMIPGLAPTENARVMDADDIEGMVEAYVQAARRAVEAGFDAVEIHGAHGYLINQFMSPLTNLREDAYGGSFENRMRFPLEVLRAVRKQVGPDFPILFRYSMEEFMPGGIDMEQAVRIAKVMADNGVDMLNVSIGIGESVEYIIPPASVPAGTPIAPPRSSGPSAPAYPSPWWAGSATARPPKTSSLPARPIWWPWAGPCSPIPSCPPSSRKAATTRS